ncbi:hypothetical protein LTR37_019254 [Vermiconidia calcicola]|uniref:Uncharacterized protein n=1 Tax=Vermiconidia calcicola TaxID=1690605 RepID=A0ACC3MF01_9PEZI|nr:hypothetical protein LTR37_019254 [Vermiconidia calcicola]
MTDEHLLQQELEALAGNAFNPPPESDDAQPEPMSGTMDRWQSLFGLSCDEAIERIMHHRTNLTRTRVSDAHWDVVRAEKENSGYDREAYEYELELQKRKAMLSNLLPSAEDSNVTYLVQMDGPLADPEKVRRAADMSEVPSVVTGQSLEEGRSVSLCCIDASAKAALLRWAADEGRGFEPTVLVNPKSLQ